MITSTPRTAFDALTSAMVAIVATVLLLVLHATGSAAQAAVVAEQAQGTGTAAYPSSAPVPSGSARVTWPRATRALQRGEVLAAPDFTLADTIIVWRWSGVPDTTRAVAGWVTRRAIAAGEFLRSPAIAPAIIIAMGSAVAVLWQDGTLRLTLKGTATNNAALGAPVGVRIDRNRRLDGIAVAPNTVRLR